MKAQLFGKQSLQKGSSTLEILIAFAILVLAITSVIGVVFGNQSLAVDTQVNNEAIYRAQKGLEDARATSRNNFLSITATSSTEINGVTYTKSLAVTDLSQCQKQATSTVQWTTGTRTLKVELATLLGDVAGALALGNDCDATGAFGNWNPPVEKSGLNIEKATGVDVAYHRAFLALNTTPASKNDLAIIDVTSSTSPVILNQFDVKNQPGFNAIDVATSSNGHLYAYIANNNAVGQLLIEDVTVPTAPVFVASSSLPGITTGVGRSIFYYDRKVYIGTQYFVCPGCNELHIYDVSNPLLPTPITSIDVGRNVNAIYVRDGLAFLATGPGTSAQNPLKIYDVDPSSGTYKQQVGSFTATGDEEGESIYVLGNKAYLGLERATGGRPDFYVLDISNLSSISTFGSKNLSLNSSAAVVGIRVSGSLGFLGTSDPNKNLMVIDVSKSTLPTIGNFNFAQTTTGVDLDDNTVYISSFSGSRSLEIVGPTN